MLTNSRDIKRRLEDKISIIDKEDYLKEEKPTSWRVIFKELFRRLKSLHLSSSGIKIEFNPPKD